MNVNQEMVTVRVKETLIRQVEFQIPLVAYALMTNDRVGYVIQDAEKDAMFETARKAVADVECVTTSVKAWAVRNPNEYIETRDTWER